MTDRLLSRFETFVENHLFWPVGRLVEWLSLIVMVSWTIELTLNRGLFLRDSYRAFTVYPQWMWAALFGAVATAQVIMIFYRGRRMGDLRFGQMTINAGVWWWVAGNFFFNTASTTAAGTYGAIALITTLLALRLGWKSSSYN